jgi:hypothetical protein
VPEIAENNNLKISIDKAESIEDNKGNLIKISDLMHFDSESDADKFAMKLISELKPEQPIQKLDIITQMASDYDVLVAQKSVFPGGSVNLRVAYGTSGDSHTGYVTYNDTYTTFTGFTLGFEWNESTCNSYVTSSGKDIFAYTSGTLDYYLFFDGFISLYSAPVSLSGYAYAIR